MEKKVLLTQAEKEKLIDDMYLFNYLKDTGSTSYNDYYSTIIINTDEYIKDRYSYDETIKILKDNIPQEKLSDFDYNRKIVNINYEIKGKSVQSGNNLFNDSPIFIQWNEYTDKGKKLSKIIDEGPDALAAKLFRNIIQTYLSLPQYIREQIVYKDQYDTLILIKEKNRRSTITTNSIFYDEKNVKRNNEYYFELIDIVAGKEEFHTYVVGYVIKEDNTKEIKSFKLSSIKKVVAKMDITTITKEEKESICKKIKDGPAFLNHEYIEFKVKFTNEGQELYKKLYKDRPKFDSKKSNNDIFYFNCTEFQMINYLKQFGKDAILLEPIETRNQLINYYKDALESYSIFD